jgi:tRNA dimethylallyltransferase
MARDRHSQELAPPDVPDGSSTLACSPSASRTPPLARSGPQAGDADAAGKAPRLGDDCWVLSGPTASGKTALAVALAERLDAEIVSVDSMAVYRGLDIGTAKPTAAEQAAARHHCLDLVGPEEPFSVAQWLGHAARAVADIRSRGRRALFVGGTPLYLRVLRDGLAPLPAEAPETRAALAEEAARGGLAALHARLAALDPAAAARIHPHDTKRIIRALEVISVTGRPMTASWQAAPRPDADGTFTGRMLVVDLPRHVLADRIDRRVERMFATGLIEETRAARAGGGIGPTAGQAAGYAEAIAVLDGALSLRDAIARTQTRTRQLAKRQLTWLRSFPGAIWVTG